MRFLKPLLAGATLMALAVPALASADPSWGGREQYRDHRTYERNVDRGYDHRGDRGFFNQRVVRHDRFAFRDHFRRDHRWESRGW
jgi:hypothetical protein